MKLFDIGDKVLNIDNISTVLMDERNKKVIFNFSNSINIIGRHTPDYAYKQFNNTYDMYKYFDSLIHKPQFEGFFSSEDANINEIVNPKNVTTILFKDNKSRVIFNLNYGIDVKDRNNPKNMVKISKFVFWDFEDEELYEDFKNKIKSNKGE